MHDPLHPNIETVLNRLSTPAPPTAHIYKGRARLVGLEGQFKCQFAVDRPTRPTCPARPTSQPQPNHDSPATLSQKCVHFRTKVRALLDESACTFWTTPRKKRGQAPQVLINPANPFFRFGLDLLSILFCVSL